MNKQISYKIVSLVFSVLVFCFVIAFYAVGWEEPGFTPLTGNAPAPLNVSNVGQVKMGGLALNTGADGIISSDGATNGLLVYEGNVGIGTTSPIAQLHIAGKIEADNEGGSEIRLSPGKRNASINIISFGDSSNFGVWNGGQPYLGMRNYGGTVNSPDNTKEGVSPDPRNNILAIVGWGARNDSAVYLERVVQSANIMFEVEEDYSNDFAKTAIVFRPGNETYQSGAGEWFSVFEAMRITSGGNVGIGTPNPAAGYKLDVQGAIQAESFDVGDITFRDQETQKILWRMFEDEDGLYLESMKTGKVYRFLLEELSE